MGTVVVCGPMACGKTSNSGHLLEMFGSRAVVDDWDPKRHQIWGRCLHLTFVSADVVRAAWPSIRVVEFASLKLPSGRRKADPGMFRRARERREIV